MPAGLDEIPRRFQSRLVIIDRLWRERIYGIQDVVSEGGSGEEALR